MKNQLASQTFSLGLSPQSPLALPKRRSGLQRQLSGILLCDARCPDPWPMGRKRTVTSVGALQVKLRNDQGSIFSSHVSNHLGFWDRFPGAWVFSSGEPDHSRDPSGPCPLRRGGRKQRIHEPPRDPPRQEIALYGPCASRDFSSPPFVHSVCLTWRNAPGGDDGQTASVVKVWLAVGGIEIISCAGWEAVSAFCY